MNELLASPILPSLAKFGATIGALSSPDIHIGSFYLTPEIAFLVGNAFAYAVNPKGRFKFTLVRIEQMASGCYDFVFKPDRKLGVARSRIRVDFFPGFA